MDISKLDNLSLIGLCARQSKNLKAWREFYNRFDECIWLAIIRECKEKLSVRERSQFDQIVQDLVQDVYMRILEKDCKALRTFKGNHEHSVYLYLSTISKNVVRNHLIKMAAQKRPVVDKSIHEEQYISSDGRGVPVAERIPAYADTEEPYMLEDLENEIDSILDIYLKGKDRERNKIIFKMHFYEECSAEEIARQFNFGLSSKRIGNIISELKQILRKALLERRMEMC